MELQQFNLLSTKFLRDKVKILNAYNDVAFYVALVSALWRCALSLRDYFGRGAGARGAVGHWLLQNWKLLAHTYYVRLSVEI